MIGEFSGKVSIVTGASSGLGKATSIMFASKGGMVTLCGRDKDRLMAVQDQCTEASGGQKDRFLIVQGDITDAKVREDTVAKTVEKFGRLDILVPNAGIIRMAANLADATEETFDDLFNTNVKSVFFLIQQAVPHLEKSKGNIISVSSIAAKMAYSSMTIYAMSKATIDHMTRCLALDLGPKGIRVNAINPSYIATKVRKDLSEYVDEVMRQKAAEEIAKQPLGKFGTTDDVTQAICFLASESAKFITGECFLVDGGRTLNGPPQM